MQYCAKCKNLCEDPLTVCPHCRRSRFLHPVKESDTVFLRKCSEFETGEISALFEENGIRFETQPCASGLAAGTYDSETMPTDRNLFVAYGDLERAKQLLEQERAEAENGSPREEEPQEEMPRRKRILVQIVSVLAFLILVTLVVLGADFVAGALRDLLFGG